MHLNQDIAHKPVFLNPLSLNNSEFIIREGGGGGGGGILNPWSKIHTLKKMVGVFAK